MIDRTLASRAMLLASLPAPLRDQLLDRAQTLTLAGGEPLFREGETAEAAYVVLDGLIKLSTSTAEGNEAVIGLFEAGESLAEALALTGETFPVDAVALRPSKVLLIPHGAIREVLLKDRAAMVAVLASTFRHLHHLLGQIRALKTRQGTERLAVYVMEQAERSGGCVFSLPCEKSVLAGYLGMTPESLSRSFRVLRDHGIAVDGTTIHVRDGSALRGFLDRVR